ncbi:MAG: metal ABC transporter ATP-binding protein [Propionibacteriaceae bacterium]|jgi:zinc transport system ATP-binding protein|nr:metal ABC transporter ATP-binding protein [Propionibacteriaceae bacterium]
MTSPGGSTGAAAASTPVISVRRLGVSLGGLPILREVDVTVNPGQIVALLGGNGSGKTTLLRAILNLIGHQAGTIELFGQPQAHFHGWARIGYVPQKATIGLHATTLSEVVHTGTLAYRHGGVRGLTTLLHHRRNAQVVDQALTQVGLTAQAKELFTHLSGGQQQRGLIARALAQQPDVLVLDEPFAGVDQTHQHSVAHSLATFRDRGGAVLVVLHETEMMAEFIDTAVVLREGRVIHHGALPPQTSHHHGHESEPTHRPVGLITGIESPWPA